MNNRHMESWRQVEIFHTGDLYYESLLKDISQAQISVTIETYIFVIDSLTKEILAALAQVSARGLPVKIIVDGFGTYYDVLELDRFCQENRIEFRVYHPLPYPLFWARNLFSKYSSRPFKFFKNINRRNHRKVTIIDEEKAYLGSLNYTQIHCAKWSGEKAWRDTGVAVQGDPVKLLVAAFQISYLKTFVQGVSDWLDKLKRPIHSASHRLVRLNSTPKLRKSLYKDLLTRINTTERRIYITTAYFIPKRSLLTSLIKAHDRGVEVCLLLPGKSDVPFVQWASYSIVRLLVKRGVPVYTYEKSILHAKTMILDNTVIIGSTNLNHRSLLHDLEVEVLLDDTKSIDNMVNQWKLDLQSSKLSRTQDLAHPHWLMGWAYRMAFKLRYLL